MIEPRTPTLAVAAAATFLVLAVFAGPVTTVGESALSLHAGVGGETWALSSMSLGLAASLLPLGAIADELGRRRVLVLSTALLALTNAVAAVAPAMSVLVVARVLQGIAGAGVLTASLAAIGHAFPAGRPRTQATAAWGAAVGGGIAFGPIAHAALAAPLGWRSGYWAHAIAAAVLLPAARTIAESKAAARARRDVPGIATLGTGMALLTAGLVEGRSDWASATTLALLAGGALALATFAAHELRRHAPLVDLRLFGEPLFVASIVGALFTGLAVAGVGSGIANAALGRLAVESVRPDRAGMGSGANNTARYLGGAAGVALVIAVVSATGGGSDDATKLLHGWHVATLTCAALCAIGALIAAVAARRHVSA